MSEVINVENQPQANFNIREDIVQTAVKFLQNNNVLSTPLAQRQNFLKRKGLSDDEVRVACERAGAYAQHDLQTALPPMLPAPYQLNQMRVQRLSVFDMFKEIVHNVALLSAVAYALYTFYKKFIKPYLFGEERVKTVEERLDELSKSVTSSLDDMKEQLTSVRVEVDKINLGGEISMQRQLCDLKSEISTVKGILVSRKQFPSVSNTPVVPPSIPHWQLISSNQSDGDVDAKSEDLMEMGSGSGSEHEHVTKTSESSLEIMEEQNI